MKIAVEDEGTAPDFCVRISKPRDAGAAKRAKEHIQEILPALEAAIVAEVESSALSDEVFQERMISIQAADMLFQAQAEALRLRAELLRDAVAGRIGAADLGMGDLEDV